VGDTNNATQTNVPVDPSRDDSPAADLAGQKLEREIENLALTKEKTLYELRDLRRAYVFRNPGFLTALITTAGALATVGLLISNNYYQLQNERRTIATERTSLAEYKQKLREDDLKVLDERSRERLKEADDRNLKAAALEKEAEARGNAAEQRAAQRIADASQRAMAADEKTRNAEEKARDAEGRARSSLLTADAAQLKLKDAERDLFKNSSLPTFVLDQQSQFKELHIVSGVLPSFSWLRSPVEALSLRIPGGGGGMPGQLRAPFDLRGLLPSVPSTVHDLSIVADAYGDDLDLTELERPEALTSLSIIVERQTSLGDSSYPRRSLRGLARLRNLERLELMGLHQRLAELAQVPNLRQLLIDSGSLENLPPSALGVVTDLHVLKGAASTSPYASLSNLRSIVLHDCADVPRDVENLPRLRKVVVDTALGNSFYQTLPPALLRMRQLTQIGNVTLSEDAAPMPWIREVRLSSPPSTLDQARHVFPNIEALDLVVGDERNGARGDSTTPGDPSPLEKALRRYTSLRRLSVTFFDATQFVDNRTPPTSFRNMDWLEELDVNEMKAPFTPTAFQGLRRVRRLAIACSFNQSFDLSDLQDLEELSVWYFQLCDEGLVRSLGRLGKLRRLELVALGDPQLETEQWTDWFNVIRDKKIGTLTLGGTLPANLSLPATVRNLTLGTCTPSVAGRICY
jgi:hypothetical protein